MIEREDFLTGFTINTAIMEIALDDLKTSLKGFIASTAFTDTSKLKDDTLIFREGFFDSMGFMSLITFLEDNYQVQITDSDLIEDNFESINAIVGFVVKKKTIS